MRRSVALLLGILGGLLISAAFARRRQAQVDRADLYFDDGSMVSLTDGSPDATRLLPLARQLIARARRP